MTAKQLFEAGKVRDAEGALAARLREHPTDVESRTFLFELLCFSGQYDRAERHLNLLAQAGKEAEMGAVLYYSALHAEKTRHELFRKEEFPGVPAAASPPGKLNGRPFRSAKRRKWEPCCTTRRCTRKRPGTNCSAKRNSPACRQPHRPQAS